MKYYLFLHLFLHLVLLILLFLLILLILFLLLFLLLLFLFFLLLLPFANPFLLLLLRLPLADSHGASYRVHSLLPQKVLHNDLPTMVSDPVLLCRNSIVKHIFTLSLSLFFSLSPLSLSLSLSLFPSLSLFVSIWGVLPLSCYASEPCGDSHPYLVPFPFWTIHIFLLFKSKHFFV